MNPTHLKKATELTKLYAYKINQVKKAYTKRIEDLESLWRRDMRAMAATYQQPGTSDPAPTTPTPATR